MPSCVWTLLLTPSPTLLYHQQKQTVHRNWGIWHRISHLSWKQLFQGWWWQTWGSKRHSKVLIRIVGFYCSLYNTHIDKLPYLQSEKAHPQNSWQPRQPLVSSGLAYVKYTSTERGDDFVEDSSQLKAASDAPRVRSLCKGRAASLPKLKTK